METTKLWYDRPAESWREALPLGNGRMGAMVFGRVGEECICLNEESIWEKKSDDYHNPKAVESLPKLRQLIFDRKIDEAQQLAKSNFISIPPKFGSFVPYGDLIIRESDVTRPNAPRVLRSSFYEDYRRTLDLDTGILHVDYTKAGIRFHREYFISCPDGIMAVHCYHESEERMDYQILFAHGFDNCGVCSDFDDRMIFYKDQLTDHGISFCGAAKAVARTGNAQTDYYAWKMGYAEASLDITDTNDFVLYLAVSTDYRGKNPDRCFLQIEKAAKKGYEAVRWDHIRDYSLAYHRFEMKLVDESTEDLSLPVWLDRVRSGNITPAFMELIMNYSRYLLISASREGGLPSNLQGVWNEKRHPACESDYHTNINLQINYWTAQAWGLPECEEPLVRWLEELIPGGRLASEQTYGIKAWTVHHCSDIFGYAFPNFDVVGLWPMGGPWMCRHLYENWKYRQDHRRMRNEFYPVLRESVIFVLDYLVSAPEGSACPGCLVTNPSMSPENTYLIPGGGEGILTYASTMDMEIIRDLFSNTMEMIAQIQKDVPGFDQELNERMEKTLARLPAVAIRQKYGSIQEWIEDYEEKDPGHRHVSQLYGVYPGRTISPERTPELAKAAARTVERKYETGYDGQGWSLGWIGNIMARLKDGNVAYAAIKEACERHLLPNLMINAHGNPQVGDLYAIPAAVLEMLVQSHSEQIVLLPALPDTLPSGSVRGLCLRGNHRLDMEWENMRLQKAVIYHNEKCVHMPIFLEQPEKYKITEKKDRTVIERI